MREKRGDIYRMCEMREYVYCVRWFPDTLAGILRAYSGHPLSRTSTGPAKKFETANV